VCVRVVIVSGRSRSFSELRPHFPDDTNGGYISRVIIAGGRQGTRQGRVSDPPVFIVSILDSSLRSHRVIEL
jgi:hypothetical protein